MGHDRMIAFRMKKLAILSVEVSFSVRSDPLQRASVSPSCSPYSRVYVGVFVRVGAGDARVPIFTVIDPS